MRLSFCSVVVLAPSILICQIEWPALDCDQIRETQVRILAEAWIFGFFLFFFFGSFAKCIKKRRLLLKR